MRLIRFLTLLVLQAVLLGLALHALLSGWAPYQTWVVARVPARLVAMPGTSLHSIYWVVALLLPLLYWVATLAIWRRRPPAVRVRTAGGDNLLIHPGAILKFVRRQVEDHPAVVSQKVRVRQSGTRGISITVYINVRPIQSLVTIKNELEASIREGFSQVMGIEKIDDIAIVIGLDDKSLNNRPGPQGEPAAKPEPPARGALTAAEDDHIPMKAMPPEEDETL
jgi:hypothetical protein